MDEMNKGQQTQGSNMNHGMCHMCNHRFFFLRWILGLIILAMVFGFGVLVGTLHGAFDRGGYGEGYDMHERGGYMMGGAVPNMMQGKPGAVVVPQANGAPAATTPVTK